MASSEHQIKITERAKSFWMESDDCAMIPSSDNDHKGLLVTTTENELMISSNQATKAETLMQMFVSLISLQV